MLGIGNDHKFVLDLKECPRTVNDPEIIVLGFQGFYGRRQLCSLE